VSTDDLESYEADLRLLLYREYRDVVGMFRYVVETERGVYLANDVAMHTDETGGRARVTLELHDAWVWDMYRPQRFVPSVRIVTFRDVVVEEIGGSDLDLTKAGLGDGAETSRAGQTAPASDVPAEGGPPAGERARPGESTDSSETSAPDAAPTDRGDGDTA
jgi:hypothetical protein